jgi:hypothetical protein
LDRIVYAAYKALDHFNLYLGYWILYSSFWMVYKRS